MARRPLRALYLVQPSGSPLNDPRRRQHVVFARSALVLYCVGCHVPPRVGRTAGVDVTQSVAPSSDATPILPAASHAWSSQPSGSTTSVFRELYVGLAPSPHEGRTTWTLMQSGLAATLRVERQSSSSAFLRIDPTSLAPDLWAAAVRTEYAGTMSPTSPPFTMTLQRTFGPYEPDRLVLNCVTKSIDVHPAFVTLVHGWRYLDDSTEPASWAPLRVEPVDALSCRAPGRVEPFSDGLTFVRGKTRTARDHETLGVEWAFVHSDNVTQQGGYRWIPVFSPSASP